MSALPYEEVRYRIPLEVVVDAALVKAPKPSPEVFEITLKKLSLEPTTCWIIEDSINGLIAARQADCFAVGMTTSFSSQPARKGDHAPSE